MKERFLIAFCISQIILIAGDCEKIKAQSIQTDSANIDRGWPRQITKDGATLIYYQPQIEDWKDYRELFARIAFSLRPEGGKETLGVASVHCSTIMDKDNRTVYLRDIDYTNIRFPSLNAKSSAEMQKLFHKLSPKGGEPVSVDRVMADLEYYTDIASHPVKLKNNPPDIFYSSSPAILLIVEGDPVFAPIDKTNLQYIVNTNWDLFFDKSKKTYYLLVDNTWLSAKDLKGRWSHTMTLPKDMSKLPADQNFEEIKKMVPPSPPDRTLRVFFSNKPAELILIKEKPVYAKISGTRLLYISNTDNYIFLHDVDGTYYLLLSGRWFKSKNFIGPWSYAGDELLKDFAKIPEDAPVAHVLASVPGTIQAAEAVMLAQIPTTAIVNKAEAEVKVKVSYDGMPEFQKIENTSMEYAINTQEKVIKIGYMYYLCFQAVWFISSKPTGSWLTLENVPKEIYTIPPSSPVYNITYVTQHNLDETTVESSFTGGYLGMFVKCMGTGATIAYGPGYYYAPYINYNPGVHYPIYRPWPTTYSLGAVYNPWTGEYALGRSAYGPYGSAHSAGGYNPASKSYIRSSSVQGWHGGRTIANAYNPWTGGYSSASQGHNIYAQWGNCVSTSENQWAKTGHIATVRGTNAGNQTSSGDNGSVTNGENGSVIYIDNSIYAGHDGNVYKKNSNGNWSLYGKGNWDEVNFNRTSGLAQQQYTNHGLERSAESRKRGQLQTERFQGGAQISQGFQKNLK